MKWESLLILIANEAVFTSAFLRAGDRTWPPPNLDLLNAALAQTGWKGAIMTATNWRSELRQRIESLDWERARADVPPFLERGRDLARVTVETLRGLLDTGAKDK